MVNRKKRIRPPEKNKCYPEDRAWTPGAAVGSSESYEDCWSSACAALPLTARSNSQNICEDVKELGELLEMMLKGQSHVLWSTETKEPCTIPWPQQLITEYLIHVTIKVQSLNVFIWDLTKVNSKCSNFTFENIRKPWQFCLNKWSYLWIICNN